mgnify:FL=1
MNGNILYNTISLQTYNPATRVGIITNMIDHTSIPEKQSSVYALAHSNSSVISYVNYPSKKITIGGVIKGSSEDDLDVRTDAFKGYFIGQDKNLDIDYAGSTRRYIATANSISVTRQQSSLYATFAIEFLCTQPFGIDTADTTALNTTGNTTSNYNPSYTFLGSAPYQLPVITVTYSAMTGNGTAQLVRIGNNDTGQVIVINRIWSATDVIVIDCYRKLVQVNGLDVPFTGAFPEFHPGPSAFSYSDTLTTRTFAFNVIYKVAYL